MTFMPATKPHLALCFNPAPSHLIALAFLLAFFCQTCPDFTALGESKVIHEIFFRHVTHDVEKVRCSCWYDLNKTIEQEHIYVAMIAPLVFRHASH